MRVLYLDCFSGISGDMMVGALCDLGVSPSTFEWELSKIELGDYHTHFERDSRQHIQGIKFGIHEGATHKDEHGHCGHDHDHHDHGRIYTDIRALIESSDLSDGVKKRSLSLFRRLAFAEGRIHGIPPDQVEFHEVGALDSIADMICACVGLEQLGVETVHASPLVDGRGWVEGAHGRFPVPAPATLELLEGIPLEMINLPHELITPTGAALLAEFSSSFGPMPGMRVLKTGYGLGSRDLPDRPNALRAILGERQETTADGYETDEIVRIETNLDDASPELAGVAMDHLFAAGALDVFFTPAHMKKNRPAFLLTVLCEPSLAEALAEIIFRETTSFGLRMDRIQRLKLARRVESVDTPYGRIDVKIGFRGAEILQVAPELESCRAAAEGSGVPLAAVFAAARESIRRTPADV